MEIAYKYNILFNPRLPVSRQIHKGEIETGKKFHVKKPVKKYRGGNCDLNAVIKGENQRQRHIASIGNVRSRQSLTQVGDSKPYKKGPEGTGKRPQAHVK